MPDPISFARPSPALAHSRARSRSACLRSRVACVAAIALLGCLVLPAATAAAQTTPAAGAAADPGIRVSNANIRTVPATGALAAQFKALVDQQTEPAWIAYTQPVIDNQMVGCCYGNGGGIIIDGDGNNGNSCCGMCRLEGDRDRDGNTITTSTQTRVPAPIKLEGSPTFAILFRIVSRQIDKVRVFSADCDLDGGGRTVHLLTGVRAADSVALLESLVKEPPAVDRSGSLHGAILAIALHRDAAADASLQRLLAATYTDGVRRDAVFWLAKARGRAGFEAAKRVIADDKSGSVRKHAVFALSQSREPDVMPTLTDLARNHPSPDVRGEALFWMANKAGAKTAQTITEAIEHDPDTEVKKRAVFALSQMPKDQGVPLLIQVARTNTNPAVRKQAMFWLGQSKDPRAIDFFEQVLK
jgi:hypothetical protein